MIIIIMNIDNYQQHILSIAQAWVLSQLYHPSCPPVHGHYLWLKWWGVRPSSLWLICKCPLTELWLHVALPLLPCISFPILEGLCKGLVPFYWMGLEPERGLRCKGKAGVKLPTWCYGGHLFSYIPHHHESLYPLPSWCQPVMLWWI